MKLEYTATGKFVPEAQQLIEDLEADGVLLLIFGSRIKGSGACCELRVSDPQGLALVMVEELRRLADAIEADAKRGPLAEGGREKLYDQNGHEQAELKHPKGGLRPGQPSPGNHL